jgi:large subunit ribosomal protein L10
LNKTEKEHVISELHKRVEQFKAVVLTNYRGLNVEQMTQLRRRLREEKISYNVVKNTMMKLAAKGTDLEKLNDYFEGPTAVAISHGDPIPLAKILTEFQKTLPSLEIRAVLVEGKVTPPSEVKSLASMPPREVIFAQVLGGIQTPAGQLAGTIQSAIQQVLGALQARADQLAASSETESNVGG